MPIDLHAFKAERAGFSLVEVLVAVTLIGIAMLGYGALNIASAELAARNDTLGPESAAAAAKLEELARTPYADLAEGKDIVTLPGGEQITRKWAVQDDTPIAGCRTVTTSVIGAGPMAQVVTLTAVFTDLDL